MKIFDIKNNSGSILIHMNADNSKYTVTYDHGKLIFQNDTRKYTIPKNVGYKLQFDKKDPNTTKLKYKVEDIRNLYRDTTPTDFGISNKIDVALSSEHFTEEIIVNGINDYIPVIAPNGVLIYVNGSIVPSGTLIDNGDKVKFKLVAANTNNTTTSFNLAVGDISKSVSLKTINTSLNIADIFNDGSSMYFNNFETNGSLENSKFGTKSFKSFGNYINTGVVQKANQTISLWYNITAAGYGIAGSGFAMICGMLGDHDGGSGINIQAVDAVNFSVGVCTTAGWISSPIPIVKNVWNNIIIVTGTNKNQIYINGVLVASNTGSFVANSTGILLGTSYSGYGYGRSFGGYLDQIRIFNRQLTTDEINKIYTEK